MTPVRDPKQHFLKPLGKHLGAIWETFGSHLRSIWELEAEEASGRHLESKSATPPKRNAKAELNFQFYFGFLKVGVPKYCKLQAKMLGGKTHAAADQARPLSKTVRTPTAKAVLGRKNFRGSTCLPGVLWTGLDMSGCGLFDKSCTCWV